MENSTQANGSVCRRPQKIMRYCSISSLRRSVWMSIWGWRAVEFSGMPREPLVKNWGPRSEMIWEGSSKPFQRWSRYFLAAISEEACDEANHFKKFVNTDPDRVKAFRTGRSVTKWFASCYQGLHKSKRILTQRFQSIGKTRSRRCKHATSGDIGPPVSWNGQDGQQ